MLALSTKLKCPGFVLESPLNITSIPLSYVVVCPSPAENYTFSSPQLESQQRGEPNGHVAQVLLRLQGQYGQGQAGGTLQILFICKVSMCFTGNRSRLFSSQLITKLVTPLNIICQIREATNNNPQWPLFCFHLPAPLWLCLCQYRREEQGKREEVHSYCNCAEERVTVWSKIVTHTAFCFEFKIRIILQVDNFLGPKQWVAS